jgi:hypothetical protein
MKRLFITVCSIALIYNYALAQDSDASLARVDRNDATAKAKTSAVEVKKTNVAESDNKTVRPAFILPAKSSMLDNKVGPNGEALLMKKNKYYYIDQTGKKIKVRSSELKDKPKSS